MKKKVLIIICIIFIILVILGLSTSFKDNARVRTGLEPKYTIKVTSKDGSKVTYWGLGYKVVRYVSVSPSEPYENNIGVKYGSWFMKYEINQQSFTIIDEAEEQKIPCASALQPFYEDESYTYFWSCEKNSHIIVKYNDGTKVLVSDALKNGDIKISDLDKNNVKYYKEDNKMIKK